MVASIWLQPDGTERDMLRDVIAALAAEHGTVPFEPHLTVCTIAAPTPEGIDAAADYIANCRILPLEARKAKISYSTTVPFRAVVIDVENTGELRDFRETLRRLTGANELVDPHISLLYTIDGSRSRVSWSGSEDRLRTIAADCGERLAVSRFRLAHPVLVAPEGDWTNIRSWTTLRRFRV